MNSKRINRSREKKGCSLIIVLDHDKTVRTTLALDLLIDLIAALGSPLVSEELNFPFSPEHASMCCFRNNIDHHTRDNYEMKMTQGPRWSNV